MVLSNEIIMPRSFILKPGQSMLVSGLSRIDYVEVCTFPVGLAKKERVGGAV